MQACGCSGPAEAAEFSCNDIYVLPVWLTHAINFCAWQALGLLAQKTDAADLLDSGASGGGGQAALKQQQETAARLAAVREAAARCIMSIITSLDQWSGPLKEAFAARNAATTSAAADAAGKQGGDSQVGAHTGWCTSAMSAEAATGIC
jgi:hypothetical protein